MAVKNGREELMALLVKALDEIKLSGELEEMFKKYGLDQPE
jgi:ABC-type amino acid transport substrate-binding protein